MTRTLTAYVALLTALAVPVWAADPAPPAPAVPGARPAAPAGERRANALNFEGSVVEGMNKNPLNSVENSEKLDGRHRPHLYKKREHYRVELQRSAKETGYTP